MECRFQMVQRLHIYFFSYLNKLSHIKPSFFFPHHDTIAIPSFKNIKIQAAFSYISLLSLLAHRIFYLQLSNSSLSSLNFVRRLWKKLGHLQEKWHPIPPLKCLTLQLKSYKAYGKSWETQQVLNCDQAMTNSSQLNGMYYLSFLTGS